MKCLICNTQLEPVMIYDFSIHKCYNCNLYYIKEKYLLSFFINYADRIIKYKCERHRQILFDLLNIKLKKYLYINDDIQCKQHCYKNCVFYKFKYNNFIFRFCNLKELYCFDIDNLKAFIIKSNKKSLFYYYKEIILNKIKKLFVKGLNNG